MMAEEIKPARYKNPIVVELIKNLKAVQFFVALLAAVATSKTLFWPAISDSIFATPAIEILGADITAGPAGTRGTMRLTVDKIRDCLPKIVTVSLKDSIGNDFSSRVEWDTPLLVGKNQHPVFAWKIPELANSGQVSNAMVSVSHWRCSDGPDPAEPAVFGLKPFNITPNLNEVK